MTFLRFVTVVGCGVWALGFSHCLLGLESNRDARIASSPVPGWVRSVEWGGPEPTGKGSRSEGARYLLFEWQEHPERQERFTRLAVLLENESGVQDEGTLKFQFDPHYQELWLHAVRVHRSGELMDRLDLTKIKLSQPEPGLGAHIYTGQQNAVLFVEDLRVGDVLEYAYSVRGSNPVLSEHYSARIRIQSGVPVERQRIRVVWSRPGKLEVRSPIPDAVVAPETGAEGLAYQWDFTNLPPVTVEDSLPIGFEPFPHLEFSDYGSWSEVVAWALPLYRTGEEAIPPGLRALAAEWHAGLSSDEERILAALQFVQDEIRYTGIEIGPDSHRPSQPAETFEQRFGDCKDKALLFCAILRGWGIEAYPALVNSGRGGAVADWLPTPYAFNHVIVKMRFREAAFWVDPTLSHQGGALEDRHLSPLGKALVLREGVEDLEDVPARRGPEAEQVVSSRFRIADYDAPVSLSVRTVFRAGEADRMRESLSRVGLPELAEDYRNFYARYYPKIFEAAPLEITDDRGRNVLTVVEQYRIEDLWEPDQANGRRQAQFYPDSMMDVLTDPATRLRRMPLWIPFPLRRAQELVVDLPDNDWTFPALDEEVRHDTFQFRYRRVATGSQVRFSYEIETLAGEVPPALVATYLARAGEVNDLLGDVLYRPDETLAGKVGQLNWLMVALAGGNAILALLGAVWFQWATRGSRSTVLPAEANSWPRGLSGWLILVGFGLCVTPLRIGYEILAGWEGYFSLHTWQAVAMPQGEQYHPLWGPLLMFEVSGNVWSLGLNLLALWLFFGKRRYFPVVYIAFILGNALFLAVDAWFGSFIAAVAAEAGEFPWRDPLRQMAGSLFWTAYMLKSKRVKATFIR